jgi:MFS transporter, DHA1 family, multidrug resistance protein
MSLQLVLLVLIMASSVSMMSTDMYAPSLAGLPEYFGTDAATVKLTMSLNVLAYALGTLVYGPLSERYGRRSVLIAGMASFTVFSLLCGLATSIGELIFTRVLQGLAAAAEGVIVLAVIRDIFRDAERVRALAWYGVATALTPAAAPVVGAWVQVWFGWRMNFHILTACALAVTILIARTLRESRLEPARQLSLRSVLDDYLRLLRDFRYMRLVMIGAAGFAFIMAFVTAGPFILIREHGLPTQYFGYFQGVLVLCFVAGSLLAGRLAHRCSAAMLLRVGAAAGLAGTLMLLVVVFGALETPGLLGICLALIAFGVGPIFATTPALAMDATEVRAGPAGAMLLALQMGTGAVAALAVGVFHDGTTRPFALTCTALSLLIISCLWRTRTAPALR